MLTLSHFVASESLILPCCGRGIDNTLTQVEHEDHVGYLCGGKLYCTSTEQDQHLVQHDVPVAAACELVPDPVQGHQHGPSCGHEFILHNDHYDYLVGNELHHVVEDPKEACCARGCIQTLRHQQIVRHGTLAVLRHRQSGQEAYAGDSSCHGHDDHEHEHQPLAVVTEMESDASAEAVTSKLHVNGICCSSEIPLIRNLLEPLPGVSKVEVAVITKTVMVTHQPGQISKPALVAALNSAGLDAYAQAPRQQAQTRSSWIPPWHVLLATLLLIISLLKFAKSRHAWMDNFKWLALGSIVLTGFPILKKALSALVIKVLDINMLMVLAMAGAIAIADYVEAGAVVVLFALAIFLENRCSDKAKRAIEQVAAMQPVHAVLADTGVKVPVEEVQPGTQVLVKPGEAVPLDSRVVSGTSRLDTSMLTGEPTPVKKAPGDQVLAGTVNAGSGLLQVQTEAAACDSAVARVASLVEQAASQQSPMETLVARFAKWYTPAVVAACLLLIIVPAAMRKHNLKDWVYLSLQVLVTACPCALVLSTPVVVVTGLACAAHKGVLIKGGTHLEALAKAKIITFDKTGTLTKGSFSVVHVQAAGAYSISSMLELAACVERTSAHPVAAAIVGHAASLSLDIAHAVTDSLDLPGKGVTATVAGHAIAIGNARLMQEVCSQGGPISILQASSACEGATICQVAIDGQLAGHIAVTDTLRPEAAHAIAQLHRQGVRCGMLTGDAQGAATAAAAAAGLEPGMVHAQLLPEDKLHLVKQYKEQHGLTVHVGDGVNDAPALAAADVGIAMGVAGSAMALEAADVALFTNDLRCLGPVLLLSRLARRKVLENVTFSVITKVAVLVLASFGKFTLWAAVLADVGSAILVMLNGFSLLYFGKRLGFHQSPQSSNHSSTCTSHCHDHVANSKHAREQACCGHQSKHHHQNQHTHEHAHAPIEVQHGHRQQAGQHISHHGSCC